MQLAGVAAVITGGASGLGAGTAEVLAEAGAKVALIDLDGARAAETAAAVGGVAIGADVTDAADVAAALAEAADSHGPARILVNCAGIGPHNRTLRQSGPHPLDLFERVVAVNLTGSFNCSRLAADAMAKLDPLDDGERGVIVNTASISAFDSPAGGAAYAASKAGVVGMTLPMARDLAPHGIRVMSISPGPFSTPLFHTMPDDMTTRLVTYSAFPSRAGRPREFGALVQQIVENPMLNGDVIRLDAANRPPASYV